MGVILMCLHNQGHECHNFIKVLDLFIYTMILDKRIMDVWPDDLFQSSLVILNDVNRISMVMANCITLCTQTYLVCT